MSVLDRLYRDAPDAASYARAYLQHLGRVLEQIDEQAVGAFIERLLTARLQQQQILVFGNGGSAATATHLANDLANGVEAATPPFRAPARTSPCAP